MKSTGNGEERGRRYRPVDLRAVKEISIADRPSKVTRREMAGVVGPGPTVADLVRSLPRVLAAEDLRELLRALGEARERERTILAMMGAHVIKCGLGPVVVDLLERGYITAVAMNGAGAIHDAELALWGKTSEEVSRGLETGLFGMARETALFLNESAERAAREGRGLGEVLGAGLIEKAPACTSVSVMAAGQARGLPVTVHVALGTDIVHQHPSADGAAIGASSLSDFRLLAAVVGDLGDGGVVLNMGSAVVLPEVFLKALTVARNLGGRVEGFVAANFDFQRQYRPLENVVRRPTARGGRGFNFVGHHEILIPLLAAALTSSEEGGVV